MKKIYEAVPTDETDDTQSPTGHRNDITETVLDNDGFVEIEIETAQEKRTRLLALKDRLSTEAVEKLAQFDAEERKQKQNSGPLQQVLKLLSVIGNKLSSLFNLFSNARPSTSEQCNREECCFFSNPFTMLGPSTGQNKSRLTISVEMEVVFTQVPVPTATATAATVSQHNSQHPALPN